MKKMISSAFILAAFVANNAFASWVAPVATGICTRDSNIWGKAGVCECPHATRYDNRLGQCVQGAPVALIQEGAVQEEMNLDNDTATFVLVTNAQEHYQLVLKRGISAQLQDAELQGVKYRVAGEVMEVEGDASGIRPLFIVDSIEVLDAN